MKLFLKLMIFCLVFSLAAPFFLKGPNQQPLMTISSLGLPNSHSIKTFFTKAVSMLTFKASSEAQDQQQQAGSLQPGEDRFYKWQDSNGTWQFSSEPPPEGTEEVSEVITNANANIIQGFKAPPPPKPQTTRTAQSSSKSNQTSDIGSSLDLTTIPQTQIPQLMQEAKNINKLMENRNKALENL